MSATLAAHAAQRAEQSASLRQGIAISAGLHLTLAVLLFGVLGVMRHPPVPPPPDPGPEDPFIIFTPPSDPNDGGRTVLDPPDVPPDVAEILPVVREERDDLIQDPPPVAPPLVGDPGRAIGGEPGGGSTTGIGIRPSGEDSLPNPNDPSFADIQPEVIRRVIPTYPDVARQAGLEGKVWVRILVDKHGAVRKAEIEISSAMFDDAALEASRQWTFRPAIAAGNPVAVWVRIPFDFRMK